MKVRADFVTNSSSSSYMIVHVKNQVLCELLRDYKKQLGLGAVSKNVIELIRSESEDSGSNTDHPIGYNQALAEVWKILNQLSGNIPKLQASLEEAKEDINLCFEEILFTKGYHEWGGDGDLRYDWSFPEETEQSQIDEGATEEGIYLYEAVLSQPWAHETFGTRHFANEALQWFYESKDGLSASVHCSKAKFPENKIPVQKISVRKIADKYKKAKTAAVENSSAGNVNSAIAGKTFVITGDVHVFPNRNAVKVYIEANGGKLAGSVSSQTDYLINNDAASSSSKNVAAKKNNVPIITEDEFIEKFQVQIG